MNKVAQQAIEPLTQARMSAGVPPDARPRWARLPVLGALYKHATTPNWLVKHRRVEAELRARPDDYIAAWNSYTGSRKEFALRFCARICENQVLPNARFIPGDEFGTLFYSDDLAIVELIMELEEELGVEIPDKEVESWWNVPLGDLIDHLLSMGQRTEQWPPAPR